MAISNIFGRDFYQGLDADMATCVPRVDGALFWATDTLKLYCWSGAAWNEVGAGAGGSVATDTIWDAKGDLAAGTGADTASKLSVGADGTYLRADSGEATGLEWTVLSNHDHSGDAGDGGTFDAANLTSGASTDGQVLTSDGAGGAAWEDPSAGSGDVATDTIWDAKGDLAVGTGANTASRLAVGTDGKMLYAASGEATGLKWDAAPSVGDSTLTSTYATRAAASNAGNLFFPSDGYVVERDTGAAYVPWGPLFPLTAPDDSAFAWVNQGSATITTTYGGATLYAPASAAMSIRIREKNAPSTPFTITTLIIPTFYPSNYAFMSLGFRDSSTGKLHHLRIGCHTSLWRRSIITSSSPTADVAASTDASGAFTFPLFTRITDTGTNFEFSFSCDGKNFIIISTLSRTTYLATPDKIFWGIDSRNSFAAYGCMIHWKQT